MASSSERSVHRSEWIEPPGDWQAGTMRPKAIITNGEDENGEPNNLQSNIVDHSLATSAGDANGNAREYSSPCSRDGSVYEDLGFDCMVSEEGKGVPSF